MKKGLFLKTLFAIIVSGIIMTAFYSFKTAPRKNIGLQLYSIRDSIRKDVPAAIKKVADMGYKFVEPAGYADGKFYGLDPLAFKKLLKKNGMYMLSSHCSQPLPNDTNRDKIMTWWDVCIDAHVKAGAKFLVQPSMGGDAYRSLETLKKYCDYFNEIGAKCKAKGIKFGYHNHDKEFSTVIDGQTLYDFMLKNTDPEKVFFQIDLYWCVIGKKNPVDYFNNYPGRFLLWHIKDEKEIGASGLMDFASIWAAQKKAGLRYGIVEVERYNFDQFTSCAKSLDWLNAQSYVVMPKK